MLKPVLQLVDVTLQSEPLGTENQGLSNLSEEPNRYIVIEAQELQPIIEFSHYWLLS